MKSDLRMKYPSARDNVKIWSVVFIIALTIGILSIIFLI